MSVWSRDDRWPTFLLEAMQSPNVARQPGNRHRETQTGRINRIPNQARRIRCPHTDM
jgi:hypothetical protein